MLTVFFRALILFVVVTLVMRMMGKRQIGQLQPHEFAVAVLIADLAAAPMADNGIPLLYGVVPILALLCAQVLISLLTLKFQWARTVFCGQPSVVIRKGLIDREELKRQRYNLNDLLEQLRGKDVFSPGDVDYAVLETSGELSILQRGAGGNGSGGGSNSASGSGGGSNSASGSGGGSSSGSGSGGGSSSGSSSASASGSLQGLPLTLVLDGQIEKRNLTVSGLSEDFLRNKLKAMGFVRLQQVLYAAVDTAGNLYVQGGKRIVYEQIKIQKGRW
ncbi:MAG: DUF421 domain-containing protein [Christensenellales bacterium]|jgi:uncharacterized membrane protein YcaP (DUF421 family)